MLYSIIVNNIPVAIGPESGLCPNPVSAVTVMLTVVTEDGHTRASEGGGRDTSVLQVSAPQEETGVE